ncbi:MAG TPA: M36 family metallopeptidase [Gaiellaceae bacterium]
MSQSARRRLPRVLFVLPVAVAVLVLAPLASAKSVKSGEDALRNKKAFFDVRESPSSQLKLHGRAATLNANPSAATTALKDSLGVEGFVDLDPLTSTVHAVGRTDGYLTGPSNSAASTIAVDYATNNAAALGLTQETLASLKLARDYVSIDGTHHLFYLQSINGVPVFGNGLKANVTKNGRLINILGSPLANTSTATSSPGINTGEAIAVAKRDAGALTVPMRSDSATQVYFRTVNGTRLAYETTVGTGTGQYLSVVDANSGVLLYRRSLVNYANANGLVVDYYPNAPLGGTLHSVPLNQHQWLKGKATTLSGPNVHVYSDVDDSDDASASEETAPGSYPLTTFNPAACVAGFVCTWNPELANSWHTNQDHSAVQLFYFINTFHDHLAAKPIGFNTAAGNFENDDPVQGENLDGANTGAGPDAGLPDGAHIDNANFGTPPDGQSPTMQMFLWHQPHTAFPNEDPFIASMGSDEADIVYHENTHGLSNRLVVDAQGNSTLGNLQAGSMGEAWSDWYALDFLVDQGLQPDTSADGELRVGPYVGWGNDLIRTQPIDCPVGSTSPDCHGTAGAGPGGYTYGDFGRIAGGTEVHADGEIWGETLWDLRNALGSAKSEGLITRAMELSPGNPSYLDMRNSILQADQVDFNGKNHDTIWSVFAHRGMGYFAGSLSGDDTRPVENFSLPPAKGTPTGDLTGVVTDQDTGLPVQGALVAFGGHASGFPGDLADVTDANGQYKIEKILFGTYPKVSASSPGYDGQVIPTLTIGAPHTTQNFQIRRDWAALGGGASVTAFDGPDYTPFGCGPNGAIDQSLGSGWGSDTSDGTNNGLVTPKSITIKLPIAIDVTEIQIDPSNTCGDPGSSATHHYKVETSTNGTTFTLVNEGHFYAANRGHLNTVTPLAAGATSNVGWLRFTMINPMVPEIGNACTDATNCGDNGVPTQCGPNNPGGFGGCTFMDMSEIEVFGAPH